MRTSLTRWLLNRWLEWYRRRSERSVYRSTRISSRRRMRSWRHSRTRWSAKTNRSHWTCLPDHKESRTTTRASIMRSTRSAIHSCSCWWLTCWWMIATSLSSKTSAEYSKPSNSKSKPTTLKTNRSPSKHSPYPNPNQNSHTYSSPSSISSSNTSRNPISFLLKEHIKECSGNQTLSELSQSLKIILSF